MVVTSKVIGLTLLSALSLAAPFEDSGIVARNADAVAEALLEYDLEARDAEPEAEADAEAYEFDDSLIARDAEADAEAYDDFEFALEVRYLHRPFCSILTNSLPGS